MALIMALNCIFLVFNCDKKHFNFDRWDILKARNILPFVIKKLWLL